MVMVGQPMTQNLQSSPSLTSAIQEHCLQRNDSHTFPKYVHWQNFSSSQLVFYYSKQSLTKVVGY